MARIKQVLNERRIAYEGAVALRHEEFPTEGEDAAEEVVLDESASQRRVGRRQSGYGIQTFRASTPTEPRRAEVPVEEAIDEGETARPAKAEASA